MYTAPNPYGSFFNFADPSVLGQQSFIPNPTGTFSQGTLSAMGNPSGGFNPSLAEFTAARSRDVAYQQFMARSMSTDPTTRTFSNMAMELLAKDRSTRDMLTSRYGQSNIDQMVGFALNMPSISGMMGGSARSLSIGSLAAGTSGLRWNNMGMVGDGQIQLNSAQRILEMVRGNFYTSSGAQKLDMTQGLNKDQMGAILAAGGAQGAFSGLDMGQITRKGSMQFNDSSLNKIRDFTKSAAKAISSLIDIYGDANFNELFDKAQKITGLDFSRLGNANLMQSRLASLRNTALASGLDNQTMFDMSAGLVNYGVASGFSASASGAMASTVQGRAAWTYQMQRQMAGSFFSPSRGLGTIASGMMRDQMGMSMDPLGARRNAIELMVQDHLIQGNDIDQVRAMSQVAAGSTPGATAARLDAFMAGRGVNMVNYIRSRGGARGVYEQLSPEAQVRGAEMNAPDLTSRQTRILGANAAMMLRDRGGSASGQLGNLMSLLTNLDPTTASALFNGPQSGMAGVLGRTLIGNQPGMRDSLLGAASGLRGAFGDQAQGVYLSALRLKTSNPLTANLMSGEEQARLHVANWHSLSIGAETFGKLQNALGTMDRGQLRGTILQGILDKAGGTDPSSILAMAMMTEEGRKNMVGAYKVNGGWVMRPFDLSIDNLGGPKGVDTLSRFRDAMRGVAGGDDMLRHAGLPLRGAITPAMAASFAGRYALDPAGMMPNFSAVSVGAHEEVFMAKVMGQRLRDYSGGLATLGRIHDYLDNSSSGKNMSGYMRETLNKQLNTLRKAVMNPERALPDNFDFNSMLTGGAMLQALDPAELQELGRRDAGFANAAGRTGGKIQEALKQAGLQPTDYNLSGGITLPDGGILDLRGVSLIANKN